jgi:hypothetical protein
VVVPSKGRYIVSKEQSAGNTTGPRQKKRN